MFKKSFKVKIVLPTFIVLVALVVILNIFLSVRFSALGDSLINERLVANINTLKLYIKDSRENSRVAAVSMAMNPRTIEAIKKRDTNEIIRLLTPTHDLHRINYYTICDNEGIVLARTYQPDKFGDSI